ncbi:MAG TPA: hypothetical protein VHA56_01650 [Mucilaginibacter sp.]|nr:hypothetical protein [Mucilaginibacter sp.]
MAFQSKQQDGLVETIDAEDTYTNHSPSGDDDFEGDWNDEDDEDFDDIAGDREDLHEIILENDIDDEEDDDHLPDDDF